MPRFEGGMNRDIAPMKKPGEEMLSGEQKQTEQLDQFEMNRAKAWNSQEGFRGMEAEAVDEKSFTERTREGARERLEEYEQKIEALREEISQKKDNWISRLTEFKQIRELEARLQMTERMRDIAEEDKKRTEELIAGYDHIIAKDRDLTSIKAEAKTLMEQGDQERLTAKEQEGKMRSVEGITRRHNCFIVHDIVDAEWKPSDNNKALDTKKLSWSDQLDILMALEPTISVSSLQEGVAGDGTFGKGSWGVFLSEGIVLGGSASDIGTQALGRRGRSVPEEMRSIRAIDDAIDRQKYRGDGDRDKSYNELALERPKVAGVYFKWTDDMPPLLEEISLNNTPENKYDRWWDQLKQVAQRNIPLFILMSDNHTRMISDIDFEKRTFHVAKADIHPEDMISLPGIYRQHLGAEEKKAAAIRQIDSVRHLLSSEEVGDIEASLKTTPEDAVKNTYALH